MEKKGLNVTKVHAEIDPVIKKEVGRFLRTIERAHEEAKYSNLWCGAGYAAQSSYYGLS